MVGIKRCGVGSRGQPPGPALSVLQAIPWWGWWGLVNRVKVGQKGFLILLFSYRNFMFQLFEAHFFWTFYVLRTRALALVQQCEARAQTRATFLNEHCMPERMTKVSSPIETYLCDGSG